MRSSRLAVLASAVCFSTTGTAQALGPADTSPVAVGATRLAVGALGLALVAWLLHGRRTAGGGLAAALGLPPVPGLAAAAWRAGLGVAAYQVGFFLAVRLTGVAVGTVVALGSAPVITGALGWLLGRGRPDARWAAATALATAGVGVLVVSGRAAHVDPVGVALALLAATGYAAYTVASKRLLDAGTPPESVMAAVFGTGALLLLPAFLLAPLGGLATPRGVAMAAWLGVVTTTLAYMLFARGLQRLSAAETTTLVLAEPLTAAALGILLLGEPVGATTMLGAGLVLAGLVAVASPSARTRAAVPT